MHKTPKAIARSLRAFKNAHGLGLLRSVKILPGPNGCRAARAQQNTEYFGGSVPRLPLPQCTSDFCECDYDPRGSSKLQRLKVPGPSSIRQKQ